MQTVFCEQMTSQ